MTAQQVKSGPRGFWWRWLRLAYYHLRGMSFAAAAEAQDLMNAENKAGVGRIASTYRNSDDFLASLEEPETHDPRIRMGQPGQWFAYCTCGDWRHEMTDDLGLLRAGVAEHLIRVTPQRYAT